MHAHGGIRVQQQAGGPLAGESLAPLAAVTRASVSLKRISAVWLTP